MFTDLSATPTVLFLSPTRPRRLLFGRICDSESHTAPRGECIPSTICPHRHRLRETSQVMTEPLRPQHRPARSLPIFATVTVGLYVREGMMSFKIYRLITITLIMCNPALKSQLYVNRSMAGVNLGASGHPPLRVPSSTLHIDTSRTRIYRNLV